MSECDSRRTTQNSGVMVIGESNASGSGNNNFYGVLDEVLHYVVIFEQFRRDRCNIPRVVEDLNNPVGGSSSVGDNSGTAKPSLTLTLRRRA
ncbi:uncharacterized protein E5676_scaffold108G001430 [Cucumis melo var. makuwa]|uniref:CACTA en-spm transposon protein n=1 Tax=Cucumis melo var. makuwa TaxID=1194695 RepID=A0A5A7TJE4_CUCMM|nr:uncharacterized protein E6C27_scaffold44G004400 [Cucumis melo var. makuwa]TYK05318.1 uncharacterized protein E5676_scaffold108G001430 [Cucumis melo var. makuwa]